MPNVLTRMAQRPALRLLDGGRAARPGSAAPSNPWHGRMEQALARAHREQIRQRAMIRLLTLSTLSASLVALLVGLRAPLASPPLPSSTDPPVGTESGPEQAGRAVRLVDGSTLTPNDSSSTIAVHEVAAGRVVVELERGAGVFRVPPRSGRVFVVRAGPTDLTVTEGEVEVDLRGLQTWVSVERGLARVDWSQASATLGAGTQGLFPP